MTLNSIKYEVNLSTVKHVDICSDDSQKLKHSEGNMEHFSSWGSTRPCPHGPPWALRGRALTGGALIGPNQNDVSREYLPQQQNTDQRTYNLARRHMHI